MSPVGDKPYGNDSAAKKWIKTFWNYKALEWHRSRLGKDYVYFGFPGPRASDVELWRKWISKVVAFELEAKHGDDRRKGVTELRRKLKVLNVDQDVYYGSFDDVVLNGSDLDGKTLRYDDFITLYNFDFCGTITEKCEVYGKRTCYRFESLREVLSLQRRIFRQKGGSHFALLLTVFDSFYLEPLSAFLGSSDLPDAVIARREEILARTPLISKDYQRNTELLSLFLFWTLRSYLDHHGCSAFFFPTISYQGTGDCEMLHQMVIGSMESVGRAAVQVNQPLEVFLDRSVIRVENTRVHEDEAKLCESHAPMDYFSEIEPYVNTVR